MRKILLLIITLLLLLILCACGEKNKPVSEPEEEPQTGINEPDAPQAPVTEPEETPEAADANEKLTKQINVFYTDNYTVTEYLSNILAGKSYDLSEEPVTYLDEGNLLTDGDTQVGFVKNGWVGFNGTGVTVTFDLGELTGGITEIRAGTLKLLDYGIDLPASVRVDASKDGKEYTKIGMIKTGGDMTEGLRHEYIFGFSSPIETRYIKLIFARGSSAWLFIDEISAMCYTEAEQKEEIKELTSEEYYGSAELEPVEPAYYDSSEADYDTVCNLISGLPYTVRAYSEIEADYAVANYNTLPRDGKLTDGKHAKLATYSDTAWFRMTRATARDIVFDLGKTCSVEGFSGTFLFEQDTGVKLPSSVIIRASENGVDWQLIHAEKSIFSDNAAEMKVVSADFDKAYRARFIKFTWTVSTHVYCDELEIIGRKNASAAASLKADTSADDSYPNAYPDKDYLGASNILLAYHCFPLGGDNPGIISKDVFLPHVAYYENGEPKDTFFDGYLFLPYSKYTYSSEYKCADGWVHYVDNLFDETGNIRALDDATAEIADKLSLPDYKTKVYFSILHTKVTYGDFPESFGDLDGDGKEEDMSTLEDRKKAIKWVIDEQLARYENGGYSHTELSGFYWFEEQIAYSDKYELELLTFAKDYVHEKGYKLFWIPYYLASGYSEWKINGFDLACMQPNYAFNMKIPKSRLYANAETAKLLGMAVELESNGASSYADVARFKEYLDVGAETGYMNTVKLYYQGGVPGAIYQSYNSADSYIHSMYTDTYLFTKGLYVHKEEEMPQLTPPEPQTAEIEVNRILTGEIKINSTSPCRLVISKTPKYGTLTLNENGKYTYQPNKGYTGPDSFSVFAAYNMGNSSEATVNVTVKQ